MRGIATVLGLVACLSACADGGSYGGSSYYSAPARVDSDPSYPMIKDDPYSPTIDVKTANAGERGAAPDGTEVYGLYAKIDRATGKTGIYVQWSEVYTDRAWRFFDRASSNKGQAYEFKEVDRSVTRCSYGTCVYAETYNIYIPPTDLRAPDGLNLKIYSKNGHERLISLQPALVAEFNAKLAEATKQRKK